MSQVFRDFLYEIPDSKLEGFPPGTGADTLFPKPIRPGDNFRLDKQGVSRYCSSHKILVHPLDLQILTYHPPTKQFTQEGYHNLHIQANKEARATTIKKLAPSSLAVVLVLEGSQPPVTPDEIRKALMRSFKTYDSQTMRYPTAIKLGTAPLPLSPPKVVAGTTEDEDQGAGKSKGKKWNDTRKRKGITTKN